MFLHCVHPLVSNVDMKYLQSNNVTNFRLFYRTFHTVQGFVLLVTCEIKTLKHVLNNNNSK